MAILQLDVRPRKGERRNRRAQGRVATGPTVSPSPEEVTPASPAHRGEFGQNGTNDLPQWQQVEWKLSAGVQVGPAVNTATQRLEETGITTARLDAQVILAHVLGVDRSWLFAHYEHELAPEHAERYTELIVRRIAREPVAYLVRHKEFYGIDLYVDHRVLIPRPETEMLVDQVLTEATVRAPQGITVVDVGTGSGAISLAVASNVPNAQVYALDLSINALAVARRNVERHDLCDRIHLIHSDLLTALPVRADVVVANLPYVNTGDFATLDPDVRNYEPSGALVAGPQGVDVIARLLPQLPACLNPGGVTVLEIAYDQGELVTALVEELLPQATQLELHRDYHGRDRVVSFQL